MPPTKFTKEIGIGLFFFENHEDHKLPFIKEEFTNLIEIFDPIDKKSDKLLTGKDHWFSYDCKYNLGVDKIIETIKAKDDLRFLHISCHHVKGSVQFSDGKAYTEGGLWSIIDEHSSNIKCVFLNGCDTNHAITYLPNIEWIISTNAPVHDYVAKEFSKIFYTLLSKDISNFFSFDNIKNIFYDSEKSLTTKFDILIKDSEKSLENMDESDLKMEIKSQLDKYRSVRERKEPGEKINIFSITPGNKNSTEKTFNLEEHDIAENLQNLLTSQNIFIEYNELQSEYNLLHSHAIKNLTDISKIERGYGSSRYENIHFLFKQIIITFKAIYLSSIWDLYLSDKKNLNDFIREKFKTILNEDMHIFKNRASNSLSDGLKALFDLAAHISENSTFFSSSQLLVNINSEFYKHKSIFEDASKLFLFTPTKKNDKRHLDAEYLFHKIIVNFPILRQLKLHSVNDIIYSNSKWRDGKFKFLVKFNHAENDGGKKAFRKGIPKNLTINKVINHIQSVQIFHVNEDKLKIDLAPFIIDSAAYKLIGAKINLCYLTSLTNSSNIEYNIFENPSTKAIIPLEDPEFGDLNNHIVQIKHLLK